MLKKNNLVRNQQRFVLIPEERTYTKTIEHEGHLKNKIFGEKVWNKQDQNKRSGS